MVGKKRQALGDITLTTLHAESEAPGQRRKKRSCAEDRIDEQQAAAIGDAGHVAEEVSSLAATTHHDIVPDLDHRSSSSRSSSAKPNSLIQGTESAQLCRLKSDEARLASFKSEEKPSRTTTGGDQTGEDGAAVVSSSLLSCGEAIEQQSLDTPGASSAICSTVPTKEPLPPGVIDIDDLEANKEVNNQRLNPYGREYHTYLRERENVKRERPRMDYLEKIQKDVVQDMRSMLVDWLISVTTECELMPSTLYHCVDLVDRSLSRFVVHKEDLQCLGCACLFIACKFEETSVPRLEEFTYMAAESFTKKQMVDLEIRICESLNFRVSTINTYHFLPRFTKAAGSRQKETALVHYLCELMLLHYEFLAFKPSIRAAAALYLARKTLAKGGSQATVWTPTIEFYTGYTVNDIAACVRMLHRAHVGVEWMSYEALRTKYSSSAAIHAADVPCLDERELNLNLKVDI